MGDILSHGARPPTPAEANIVLRLQRQATAKYDPSAHAPLLRRLWAAAVVPSLAGGYGSRFGYDANSEFALRSDAWKAVGFQNADPGSDVRGGGQLCLELLVSFAETHQTEAVAEIRRQMPRTLLNFPWAAAGINVSRMLAEGFGMVDAAGARGRNTVGRARRFWHFCATEEAFASLFAVAFALLARTFAVDGSSYLGFNQTLARTKGLLFEALARGPVDAAALREMLGLL